MGFRKHRSCSSRSRSCSACWSFPFCPRRRRPTHRLETTTLDNTGRLLGENSPELNPPDEAPPIPRTSPQRAANVSSAMKITVPRLGLKDVAVPTGSRQAELDKQGILHLRGSGLPWMAGSNTFITGHALGFPWTRVPYAFYKLDKMKPGDEIFVDDKDGTRYTFAVYDTMTVEPGDYWVTYPVEGETVDLAPELYPHPDLRAPPDRTRRNGFLARLPGTLRPLQASLSALSALQPAPSGLSYQAIASGGSSHPLLCRRICALRAHRLPASPSLLRRACPVSCFVEEALGHSSDEVEVVFDLLFFCGGVTGVARRVEAGEQVGRRV